MFTYDEVPAETVDPKVLAAAQKAAIVACKDLGLDRVTINWFRKTHPRLGRMELLMAKLSRRSATSWSNFVPTGGEARNMHPSDIWVNADVDEREVVRVVRHEIRHCWTYKHYGLFWAHHHPEEAEADARAYEAQA